MSSDKVRGDGIRISEISPDLAICSGFPTYSYAESLRESL